VRIITIWRSVGVATLNSPALFIGDFLSSFSA